MFWQGRPFLRILPFFAAGILSARLWPERIRFPLYAAIAILVVLIFISVIAVRKITSFKHGWIPGFILFLTLFFSGLTLTMENQSRHNIRISPGKYRTWAAEVISEPVPKKNHTTFTAKIIYPLQRGAFWGNSIKALVYIPDTNLRNLHTGNRFLFRGKLYLPELPKNPEEFNYRRYLLDKGIGYRVYIRKGSMKILPAVKAFSATAFFAGWRNRLLEMLRTQKLSRNEYAVASAILLGYDRLIDPDLHQDFTAAGAVHILCVSGMHVGIIFLIFGMLLSFLLRWKHGRILRNLLLIGIIWAYAFLTGLSPSVSRAATMLSLFIVADMLGRGYDRFNVLFASAFLLLLINPMLLFDAGFQLSYAAVSGILLFYFPVYRLVYLRYKILQTIWAALAVSFSAQLGAFAIAAHYFHQFPLYFLLTNLAVFMLSYLIIFSGMAYLIFSQIPVISRVFSFLLAKTTGWLIQIVHGVASLPHAVVYDLYFPWGKVILVLFLITGFYFIFIQKNVHFLLPVIVALVLLSGWSVFRRIRNTFRDEFIVYSLRHHTAIDLIAGNNHILLTDTAAFRHTSELNYSLENNRIMLGLRKNFRSLTDSVHTRYLFYKSGFGQLESLRFFVSLPGEKYYPSLKKKIKVDYLICRAPWKSRLKEIARAVSFKTVVLDASLSPWSEKRIKTEAKTLKKTCIDLKTSGALVVSLK